MAEARDALPTVLVLGEPERPSVEGEDGARDRSSGNGAVDLRLIQGPQLGATGRVHGRYRSKRRTGGVLTLTEQTCEIVRGADRTGVTVGRPGGGPLPGCRSTRAGASPRASPSSSPARTGAAARPPWRRSTRWCLHTWSCSRRRSPRSSDRRPRPRPRPPSSSQPTSRRGQKPPRPRGRDHGPSRRADDTCCTPDRSCFPHGHGLRARPRRSLSRRRAAVSAVPVPVPGGWRWRWCWCRRRGDGALRRAVPARRPARGSAATRSRRRARGAAAGSSC